jgi:two-component system chemotaxis response regulator CheB
MSAPEPVRVLVVDDSAFVRREIPRLLAGDPGIAVVGTAADGVEALAEIRRLAPDVVTLDVMMPRLDGLKVLAAVMRDRPARVIMLSSLTREGAEVTLQALDLGAVDFIDKASLAVPAAAAQLGAELAAKIRAAAAVDARRLGRRDAARVAPAVTTAPGAPGGADLVVIGASTGGPPALCRVLSALPADLPAGIVVVQHIPAGFTRSLAARLDAASKLAVREATHGAPVRPGEVLLAPAGVHLSFRAGEGGTRVALDPEPSASIHRPSVDVTMTAAAAHRGRRAAGVLLTGMGSDGARGMLAIRSAGGRTLAESEESCIVYGMPRAAVELGAVDESLPLERMAEGIVAATAGERETRGER